MRAGGGGAARGGSASTARGGGAGAHPLRTAPTPTEGSSPIRDARVHETVRVVAQARRELERQRQERADARAAARARAQAEAELAARAQLRTQVEEQIHRLAQSQAERKLTQRAKEESAAIALQEAQPCQKRGRGLGWEVHTLPESPCAARLNPLAATRPFAPQAALRGHASRQRRGCLLATAAAVRLQSCVRGNAARGIADRARFMRTHLLASP